MDIAIHHAPQDGRIKLPLLRASELANVLTGRGLTTLTLAAHGIQIDIEPPQIGSSPRGGVVGLLATQLGTIKVVFHNYPAA